jgi:hypothetical protein
MSNDNERNTPSVPIRWRAYVTGRPERTIIVTERLWYDARRIALRHLDATGTLTEQNVTVEEVEE